MYIPQAPQKLTDTKKRSRWIFSRRVAIVVVISLIFDTLFSMVTNEAMAEAPYLSTDTTAVPSGANATASAFCKDGDGMISGGYSAGLTSNHSTFDIMVYSNHPIQEVNNTGYFEGWEAGLVNKGNKSTQITALVLCLNLTLTA